MTDKNKLDEIMERDNGVLELIAALSVFLIVVSVIAIPVLVAGALIKYLF